VMMLRGALSRMTTDSIPNETLLQRIQQSRRLGGRVILPVEDPLRRTNQRWLIAAAVIVALLGLRVVLRPGDASAGSASGELRFEPAVPIRGGVVTARYRPAETLGRESTLTLRAALRGATAGAYDDRVQVVRVASLVRSRDGDYEAAIALPDSIVYGAFVVEDATGDRVDDNSGRQWDVLIGAPDGRPTYATIRQRINHLMGRNWEASYDAARQLVSLYPDSLGSWSQLRFFEDALGRRAHDSVAARERAILARFMNQGAGVDPGALAWYAQGIDPAVARRLRDRLLADAPTNSFAIQWRLLGSLRLFAQSHDTAALLRAADSLFTQATDTHRRGQVADYVLRAIALPAKRADLVRTWGERALNAERGTRAARTAAQSFAEQLVSIPALRQEGLARLRGELSALGGDRDGERALGLSRADARAQANADRRRILAALGRGLVAAGRRTAAMDTLALAQATGWDPGLFREIADARLVAGDSVGATELLALVAIDPTSGPGFADTLTSLLRATHRLTARDSLVRHARSEMIVRVLTDTRTRSLPLAHLLDSSGARVTFGELVAGRPTVVLFWSRNCAPAVDELQGADAMSRQLAPIGVSVLSVVEEPSSLELTTWLREHSVSTPVYHDQRGEMGRAFNRWGTPSYYLVDAGGRLQHGPYVSADDVIRHAVAMRWAESLGGRR